MRYTEARLSKISMEMLSDINKDTVDFMPNFDETEKEPVVLPSRFPNLLVNGTSGIAVGMATNIPPHNLTESINGVVKIIDNQIEEDRDTTLEEIMEIIKGPDFPTGATILGLSLIHISMIKAFFSLELIKKNREIHKASWKKNIKYLLRYPLK